MKFVENLTNWYIRRSRRRFWKSQNDTDKRDAYATLYYALMTFCKAAAPFIPYLTEEIYRSLRTEDMPESVHLCDYPEAEVWRRDESLEKLMNLTMSSVSLGRFLRTQRSLKVRQPLSRAILVSIDPEIRSMLEQSTDIIMEELNVKNVEILSNEEQLVHLSAKANFKVLGAKLGAKMKEAAAVIAKLPGSVVASLLAGGTTQLELPSGTSIELTLNDITVIRQEKPGICVATDNAITIALDTELNEELIAEGYARELVSKVQSLRKDMDLQVSDIIQIGIVTASQDLLNAIQKHEGYIKAETQTGEICSSMAEVSGDSLVDLNGQMCTVTVKKIN